MIVSVVLLFVKLKAWRWFDVVCLVAAVAVARAVCVLCVCWGDALDSAILWGRFCSAALVAVRGAERQ